MNIKKSNSLTLKYVQGKIHLKSVHVNAEMMTHPSWKLIYILLIIKKSLELSF